MRDLPFDRPGRFWRGNLHTHSDHSDGALSPTRVVELYREAGYDFVAITDHFRAEYGFPLTDTRALRSVGFTTLPGAELHAPGTELAAEWHIVAVGLPDGFPPPDPGESGPALARRARAAWVQVRAESLEPNELLAALKSGHYYSSTGPEIHAITIDGDKITVHCSPASRILVTSGVPGKRVVAGSGLTSGVLPLDTFADSAYIRVTVTGDDGGRAWSNPIWLR
jgi:hypothetical protein